MTELADPVVRTFRIPRDLYERIGDARGLESLNGEVVRRLEASFRIENPHLPVDYKQCLDEMFPGRHRG